MSDVRETKVYVVWLDGQAGPSVIEAYTVGQAVEYFLASHGLLGYDEPMKVAIADGCDMISAVCEYVKIADCDELDEHHTWEEVDLSATKQTDLFK